MVTIDLNTYNPLTDLNGFDDIDSVQLNKYDVFINHMDVIPLKGGQIDLIDFLDLFNDYDIDMIVFKNGQILTLKKLLKSVFNKIDNNTLVNINNDIDNDFDVFNVYDLNDLYHDKSFEQIINDLINGFDTSHYLSDNDRFYYDGCGHLNRINIDDVDDVIDKSDLIDWIINDKTLLKYVIFNI